MPRWVEFVLIAAVLGVVSVAIAYGIIAAHYGDWPF
jgi:hypothetical protein